MEDQSIKASADDSPRGRSVGFTMAMLQRRFASQGVFKDPKMKLLVFTEHKDTLDFLVGKLREWNLKVTQIHGSMKIGDRGLPDRDMLEHTLIEQALTPFLEEIVGQRLKEIETISRHMEISLNAIIDRVQCQFAELVRFASS